MSFSSCSTSRVQGHASKWEKTWHVNAGLQMKQTTHYVQEGQWDHVKEEPSARDGEKEGTGERNNFFLSPRKRGNQRTSLLTSHTLTPILTPSVSQGGL